MAKDFSREYATALYSLAVEEKCSERIFHELEDVSRIFEQNPEFSRLLMNPRLGATERAAAIGDVFGGKVDKNLLNALKLLAEKRRCDCVPKCYEVYKRLWCEDNGVLPVKAVSAVKLSDEQLERLSRKLEAQTGKKVLVECRVDPACIGGIRLEYGGKRFDASVRGRLEGLSRAIKSAD